MAVPAFIETHDGQLFSTVALSLNFRRGIITFYNSGVITGQEYFGPGNLNVAKAQYTSYVGVLTATGAAPVITAPTSGSPVHISDVTVQSQVPGGGSNFLVGSFLGLYQSGSLIYGDNMSIWDAIQFNLVVPANKLVVSNTYDLTYNGLDGQVVTSTGAVTT